MRGYSNWTFKTGNKPTIQKQKNKSKTNKKDEKVHKTFHRKLKFEQHKSHEKPVGTQ